MSRSNTNRSAEAVAVDQMLVERTAVARLPTRYGEFVAHVYRSRTDGTEHMALVKGELRGRENVLVRLHSECLTGDILGSLRCDCGEQLERALAMIAQAGQGVVIYLRGHEGRGIGLTHKIRAYQLQDQGRDTVDANLELGLPVDSRNYDAALAILADLGIDSVRLMSNNPRKVDALEAGGFRVTERIPLLIRPNPENFNYLLTKQQRLGHCLNLEDDLVVLDRVDSA